MKHAEAARILDLADPPTRRSTSAVALALAILTIAGIFWFAAHEVSARGSLHLAHQAGSLSRSTEFGRKTTAMESGKMKKLIAIGVVSTAISASAMAQNAVQWRVEDGGNGHWYQRVDSDSEVTWTASRDAAMVNSGYLITITSAAEQAWVLLHFIDNQPYCTPASWANKFSIWIGLWQDMSATDYSEPTGGWRWVTSEPVNFFNWRQDEPNNGGAENSAAAFYPAGDWNDQPDDSGFYCVTAYVIEWSADCNNDGIVDYGQIRAGEYADVNANNIPDCCEYSTPCDCDADIIQDNAINGVDLAAIMNAWGTDGGKIPRCDVDGSGIVDGSDLTIVLDAWGPCP